MRQGDASEAACRGLRPGPHQRRRHLPLAYPRPYEARRRIARVTAAGELVSDDTVEEIVRDRLDQHDWNYGFILDGFPRNRRQAEFFLESYDINAVIQIDLADEIVQDRVLNRRLCGSAGWTTT